MGTCCLGDLEAESTPTQGDFLRPTSLQGGVKIARRGRERERDSGHNRPERKSTRICGVFNGSQQEEDRYIKKRS